MIGAAVASFVAAAWLTRRADLRRRVGARVGPSGTTPTPRPGRDRRSRVRRRRRGAPPDAAAVLAFPDTVDLLVVAVDAGLPAVAAIAAVAERTPQPWASALGAVRDRVARGRLFAEALAELGACGEAGHRLAGVLRGSTHRPDLAGALQRLALDARDLRRRRAEEAARRVPVRLLAPLVLFVLPAFVLLALVPLVAGAFEELHL